MMTFAPARTRSISDAKSLAASASEMWITSLAITRLYSVFGTATRSSRPMYANSWRPVCRFPLGISEMIDFPVTEKHISRKDAYMLASVATDLHITELVDGNKGEHM